ncbi:hypothetical protein RFI_16077 [Reticulomyxa filosa]|uniref:Uncharacterized protein n=1 Tax=Reticulomyxa filosa TaxID=46433 RepID=X6N5A7_RETFI|nr:hypothetical protein RFI_16077 [Reticulomyxa filosa]|eukprot:ETO21128.1 hypothetical protein RFI_16077 [Reticulomyxa filosa]
MYFESLSALQTIKYSLCNFLFLWLLYSNTTNQINQEINKSMFKVNRQSICISLILTDLKQTKKKDNQGSDDVARLLKEFPSNFLENCGEYVASLVVELLKEIGVDFEIIICALFFIGIFFYFYFFFFFFFGGQEKKNCHIVAILTTIIKGSIYVGISGISVFFLRIIEVLDEDKHSAETQKTSNEKKVEMEDETKTNFEREKPKESEKTERLNKWVHLLAKKLNIEPSKVYDHLLAHAFSYNTIALASFELILEFFFFLALLFPLLLILFATHKNTLRMLCNIPFLITPYMKANSLIIQSFLCSLALSECMLCGLFATITWETRTK